MAIRAQFQLALSDMLHPTEQVERTELQSADSDRKHRLYTCACLEYLVPLLPDHQRLQAIRAIEGFADGVGTLEALEHAHDEAAAELKLLAIQAGAARLTLLTNDRNRALEAARHAAKAVWLATLPEPSGRGVARVVADLVCMARVGVGDPLPAADLDELYEDVMTPSELTLDSAWLRWHDGAIVKLAQQMYDARDFAGMPILADALEEAGCTNAELLDHCRGPGPHVRGCWVVDLILSME